MSRPNPEVELADFCLLRREGLDFPELPFDFFEEELPVLLSERSEIVEEIEDVDEDAELLVEPCGESVSDNAR